MLRLRRHTHPSPHQDNCHLRVYGNISHREYHTASVEYHLCRYCVHVHASKDAADSAGTEYVNGRSTSLAIQMEIQFCTFLYFRIHLVGA